MSVPKKRRTSGSAGKRRSHHALKDETINICPQCKKAIKPHHACDFCGYYKGKEVVKIKNNTKVTKK